MKRSIKAVIDEVIIQPSKIQPIIVDFQNGDLKDEETSRMNCGIYHDAKRDKTVLAMSNGQVVYKGYRPEVEKELTYTMLAIHNKRTGKIRLIQAERWQVAPVLDRLAEAKEEASVGDKLHLLSKQFGSKKSKRRTELWEKMKVNIDSVKDDLEQTVSNVKIDREDLTNKTMTDEAGTSENIPECNRDASRPEDVYNLYDIVPKEVLETIYDKIDEIVEYGTEGKSEFYIKMFKSLNLHRDRVEKIAILEYIEAIRTWIRLPFKDIKRCSSEIYYYSTQVNNHILDNYSLLGANGRQRPVTMRDKGLIHAMILALMISNYKLDLDLFSTLWNNLRGAKKFTDLARIIGAVPTKENKKLVVLKLPLPPPLTIVRKGRKK